MLPRPRSPNRARRALLARWTAWTFVGLLALSLMAPAEASHRPPYVIRDSDGDLWLDPIEALLGTSRYDADSDPVDIDGHCAVQSIPAAPEPDATDPGNATNGSQPAGPDCPAPAPPLGPGNVTDVVNETESPINGTDDVPILNETEVPETPETPEAPQIPDTPHPNPGSPCDIDGWPNCPRDDSGDKPSGQNDAPRDDYHDNDSAPQDDSEPPEDDPDPIQETMDDANESAEPVHNETKTVIEQVESEMNEETGLVDVTWIVNEEEEEDDADRYAIYRNNESEPAGETKRKPGQPSYTWPDRSHPEGNVTYTVKPVYDTANGSMPGNGNSSEPNEFDKFPEEVGEELRKCGPLDLDTDMDAICDAAENVLGTDPLLVDSDGDGIPDPLALRLGLVNPDDGPDPQSDDADPVDPPTTASSAEPQVDHPAKTPALIAGVLGLGASLMASAVGAIVRFRRP